MDRSSTDQTPFQQVGQNDRYNHLNGTSKKCANIIDLVNVIVFIHKYLEMVIHTN